jgi:hypothetical protein
MSKRFLTGGIGFLITLIGGIFTYNGTSIFDAALILGGIIIMVSAIVFMNNSKWNKKLWKW